MSLRIAKLTSKNHPHKFVLLSRNEQWKCDGHTLFQNCLSSGLDRLGLHVGTLRYKCTRCADFDLCRKCLKAPKLSRDEFYTRHHPHRFFKMARRCEKWHCNGDTVHGECKSGVNYDSFYRNKMRYKCGYCTDFSLCAKCFHSHKNSPTK